MKRKGKIKFFIVLAILLAFIYSAFFGFSLDNYYGDKNTFHFGVKGAKDIRWGIDINGGVEAVFAPDIDEKKITIDELNKDAEIVGNEIGVKIIIQHEEIFNAMYRV